MRGWKKWPYNRLPHVLGDEGITLLSWYVLRVSALHYSTGIGNMRGFRTSASARALRLTTYYQLSEYFR